MDTLEPAPFGTLLRRHRRTLGLSQEELAEGAELSVRQLAYLEGGRHTPRPGTVRRLADALALSDEDRAAFSAAAQTIGLAAHPANLPDEATPFIGREREIEQVTALLRDPHIRMVTLTGTGGIGKTRLAVHIGREVAARFSDGMVFVALAATRTADRVPETILGALGLDERTDRPSVQVLADHLRERELLLILDNFEHLLEAAPQVGQLIAACPRLQVIVTSRAVLRLTAEHVVAVPPLSYPAPEQLPEVEGLTRYDAVALFAARAQASTLGFTISAENAAAVVGICHHLDGVPLAIELAAARVPLLPPQVLLQRLTPTLPFLTAGARDAPDRQRTLRRTIDWSYDLLDAPEQVLFARLSVFAGGCTLEAAETICHLEADAGITVLEGVASLREKSLLHQMEGRQGEPRFTMLETIREYAQERLEARGEANAMCERHAEYFTQLAEHVEAEMSLARTDGPPSMAALHRVEEERHNLIAALAWSVKCQEAVLGLRLAGALRLAAFSLGLGHELCTGLEALLPRSDTVSPRVRAKALLAADRFLSDRVGRKERNRWPGHRFDEALTIYRQAGDKQALLDALLDVAGMTQYHWGRADRAKVLYQEALRLARELRSSSAVGASLRGLGAVAEHENDLGRARRLYEESLETERAASNTVGIAYSLHSLAFRALLDRDEIRAAELCNAAERTYREADLWHELANLQFLQGVAALMGGHHAKLYATFRQCVSEKHFTFHWFAANWLALVAASWAAQGAARPGARLYAAATTIMPSTNTALSFFVDVLEECLAMGRSQIDEATWQAAWVEGQAMTLPEAVAYALNEGAWDRGARAVQP